MAVTKRGQPVLALMPWEFYESIVETLEILGDEALMASLRQSIKEAGKGQAEVLVVAVGIRKEGARSDVYTLASKLLRLKLLGPVR